MMMIAGYWHGKNKEQISALGSLAMPDYPGSPVDS
jgi:hypothetical protein